MRLRIPPMSERADTDPITHLRIPYLRPAFMGGDVAHPLCHVPTAGWAGPEFAAMPMADSPAKVNCPRCLAFHERGGVAARWEYLGESLVFAPRQQQKEWREAHKVKSGRRAA